MKKKLYLIFIASCLLCLTRGYAQTCVGQYATLPYTQNFENTWLNFCGFDNDAPDESWINSDPETLTAQNFGWRRNDYASWPNGFNNTPPSGSYCARFHTSGTSSSGSSNLDMYINCSGASGGTQQLTFYYINGAGQDNLAVSVSTDGGSNFTLLNTYLLTTGWALNTMTFASSSAQTIVRFQGSAVLFENGSTDLGLDSVNVTTLVSCSGAPGAGTATPSSAVATACNDNMQSVSLSGYGGILGLTYQWEQSTDGGTTYTQLNGATNNTYTGPFTAATTLINCITTCTASSQSTTSSAATITNNTSQSYLAITSGTPYLQGFEGQWISKCATDDVPDTNWINNPSTGGASWRRDDDGSSAGWFSNGGMYSPAGSDANGASSSHSARFHSVGTDPGDTGVFDLYVDFSAIGTKQISYDYINQSTIGSNLAVFISTTGAAGPFTQLDNVSISAGWATRTVTTTATSATCVLRFLATSDGYFYDMGLDNVSVSIQPVCAGVPVEGTVSPDSSAVLACTANTQTLTVSGYAGIAGFTYQWQHSLDGINYTAVTGATDATYTDVFTNPTTKVNCVVTCSASGLSTTSDTATVTYAPQAYIPVTVVAPYFQGFEDQWLSRCAIDDAPDFYWVNSPSTGQGSWRREDDGESANWNGSTDGAYTPTGSNANGASSNHSARFHTYFTDIGSNGSLDLYVDLSAAGTKQISYDYIKNFTIGQYTDNVTVLLSENGPSGPFVQLDSLWQPGPWTTRTVTTTSTSATCVLRFYGLSDDGTSDIGIDNVAVTVLTPCSGTPAAGTVNPASAALAACTGNTQFFTLSGYTGATGLTYQWEQSTDGVNFTPINGATDNTYTGTFTAASTEINCIVTCITSGQSTTTSTSTVTYATQEYVTVTLANPYIQGFEGQWIDKCAIDDAPDIYWVNTPPTGDESWRRDDDGASANWDYPVSGGTYSPAGSDANGASSLHSAAFDSWDAPTFTTGTLDLYLDLSAPGTKVVSYDCIFGGNGVFSGAGITVFLSTTGPSGTFNQLDGVLTSPSWQTRTFNTTTTSNNCVLRFMATSDYSYNIGLDNVSVSILPPCTGTPDVAAITPAILDITPCNDTTQTFNISGMPNVSGFTYQWEASTDGGNTYIPITGATDTVYTVFAGSFLSGSTLLNCVVTCTNSGSSTASATSTITYTPQAYVAVTAASPYTQGFEDQWVSKCATDDAPDTYWMNTPPTGVNSWRRDDDGASASWTNPGEGTYTPTGSNANGASSLHSARFDTWDAADGTTGTLDLYLDLSAGGTKQISYDFINNSGSDNVAVFLSIAGPNGSFVPLNTSNTTNGWVTVTDTLTVNSPTCVLRFIATSDDGADDMGLDNVSVSLYQPPCDTVSGLAVTGITSSSGTVTWTAVGGTDGYDAVVDQSAGSPAGTGTSTTGATYSVMGLTASTTYYAHVRDSCGPNSFSAWTTVAFTTDSAPICDTISGLAVSSVTATGATISWNAVSGTSGYEYLVSTSAAIPAQGANVTGNSTSVTGLVANTTYYVFVRDSCDTNSFSAWDTLSFTTPPNMGVGTVNGSQFAIEAYPNPAKDIITVRVYGLGGNNRKVSLTDVAGRAISIVDMATDRVDFDMSNLAAGIYLIRYEDDAHTRVIKVNKQ